MAQVIHAERTARKTHSCEWCGTSIHSGERYVEASLPPGHDLVCNTKWLRSRRHLQRECLPYGRDGYLGGQAAEDEAARQRAEHDARIDRIRAGF